ncbi:MAG: hypothetical protein U0903_13375 [Planctomycetales bacterium]
MRVARFLLRFPLWGDEYLLAENFLPPVWSILASPLKNGQVAPLGFLAGELLSLPWFGFHEWALRGQALAYSILSLWLFARWTKLLQTGWERVFSVAILAVTYYAIRYAAEVKPYAGDLCWSMALIHVATLWWQTREAKWLYVWCGLTPFAVVCSFPAVFTAGGIALGLAPEILRRTTTREKLWYLGIQFVLLLSFVLLQWLWLSRQFHASADMMTDYWKQGFPPDWRAPGRLLAWMFETLTSVAFAAPFGATRSGSILTTACCALGVRHFWKQGDRVPCLMFGGTFLLAIVAAGLHRYPLGGHARLVQYLLPWVCLFAGTGFAQLLAWLRHRWLPLDPNRYELRTCFVLFLIGMGILTHDIVHPYQKPVDAEHQGFAHWFWRAAPERTTICLVEQFPQPFYQGNYLSAYRCYQAIHRPARRGQMQPVHYAKVEDLPIGKLRCVGFHLETWPRDESAFKNFMSRMQTRYRLVGETSLRVDLSAPPEHRIGRYDVWEFDPIDK